jgi:hypothetical protein
MVPPLAITELGARAISSAPLLELREFTGYGSLLGGQAVDPREVVKMRHPAAAAQPSAAHAGLHIAVYSRLRESP